MQAHDRRIQVNSHRCAGTACQHPPSSPMSRRLLLQRSPSNLLSSEASSADRPCPQSLQSPPTVPLLPLHVLLRGFNLWPKSIEVIDYTLAHPNWVPLVTTHVAADKDDAMHCIRTRL